MTHKLLICKIEEKLIYNIDDIMQALSVTNVVNHSLSQFDSCDRLLYMNNK